MEILCKIALYLLLGSMSLALLVYVYLKLDNYFQIKRMKLFIKEQLDIDLYHLHGDDFYDAFNDIVNKANEIKRK